MPSRDPELLLEDILAAIRKVERYTAATGLRNRIVHDYFGLDLEIIWEVIQHDLPKLHDQLQGP